MATVETCLTHPLSGYAPPRMADEVAAPPGQEYPNYVTIDADRARWDNAGKVARNVLGPDATAEAVWPMQRTIFHDRDTYPD